MLFIIYLKNVIIIYKKTYFRDKNLKDINGDSKVCPNILGDISIGKKLVNWTGDKASQNLKYNNLCSRKVQGISLPEGYYSLCRHEKGIAIFSASLLKETAGAGIRVHYSQIKCIKELTLDQVYELEKIEGERIWGPVGDILDGMSCPNKYKYFILIKFWDIESKKLILMMDYVICVEKKPIIVMVTKNIVMNTGRVR